MHQRVLLVGSVAGSWKAITDVLDRFSVETLQVPTAQLAVEVASDLPVDLIVLSYPISGMRIDHFVASVSRSELGDRGTRVLLLAESSAVERVAGYGDAALSVVAADLPEPILERQLEAHLRRAPRLPDRKMVRVEGEAQDSRLRRYLQTDNISESGMFVRMKEPLELGSRFDFELALSSDTLPIRGTAEVTRVARREEKRPGIGVRFARLDLDSRQRLREYVRSQLDEDPR